MGFPGRLLFPMCHFSIWSCVLGEGGLRLVLPVLPVVVLVVLGLGIVGGVVARVGGGVEGGGGVVVVVVVVDVVVVVVVVVLVLVPVVSVAVLFGYGVLVPGFAQWW